MKYLVIISMKETVTVVQNFLYITRWVCHGMLQFVVVTVTTVMTFSAAGSNDSSHAVPSHRSWGTFCGYATVGSVSDLVDEPIYFKSAVRLFELCRRVNTNVQV